MRTLSRAARDYLRRVVRSVVIERSLADSPLDRGPPSHFDRQGRPMTFAQWGGVFECLREYKVIRRTRLPDGKWVSTVWLGLDHGFGGRRRLIFETMVFSSKRRGHDLDQERYGTELEAIAGHNAMVEKWSFPQPTQSEGEA